MTTNSRDGLRSRNISGRRHPDPELVEAEGSPHFVRTFFAAPGIARSVQPDQSQSTFQSTTNPLTRTVNLIHTRKVRREPDFAI